MQYIANAKEAKKIDGISIEQIGIPSLVLMERAALAVAKRVEELAKKEDSILIVCGAGNNGADGVAAGRMLSEHGYRVSFLLLGNMQKASEEMRVQLAIVKNLSLSVRTTDDFLKEELEQYTFVIDAIFGIGLSREITGKYAQWIKAVNAMQKPVVSVDVPSGIDATNGQVLGIAIRAKETITFGTLKSGLLFFPGAKYAGAVQVADIGFPKIALKEAHLQTISYDREDVKKLFPQRIPYSNKGSYGKVLVIAGSKNMGGAAYFAARAAYEMGCGLVKVITHQNNRDMLLEKLPEALLECYDEETKEEEISDMLTDAVQWADVIACGPGLGTSPTARSLFETVIKEENKPVVLDADAINLASALSVNIFQKNKILTPHLKEMSRLIETPVATIQTDLMHYADMAKPATIVLKDARTVVVSDEKRYINRSGNHALAKGGSGDVLCGMIAGLLARKTEPFLAASLATYLHGLTAEEYVKNRSSSSMFASDILDMLSTILP